MQEFRARVRGVVRLTGIALVVAMAIAAGGCGDDQGAEKNSYERSMKAAAKDFQKASSVSSDLPIDATPEQRRQAVAKQAELMRATHDRMQDLDPPADAKKAHVRFVEALGEYVDLLDELSKVLGDATKEGAVYEQLSESNAVEEMRDSSADLKKLGYDFSVK